MDYSLHFAYRHYSICGFSFPYANLVLTDPDSSAVDKYRNHPGNYLCDPECIPDPGRPQDFAEEKSRGNNDHYIAEQRYDKGRSAFSQSFQCTAGGNR